jgi:hypothetical protein
MGIKSGRKKIVFKGALLLGSNFIYYIIFRGWV